MQKSFDYTEVLAGTLFATSQCFIKNAGLYLEYTQRLISLMDSTGNEYKQILFVQLAELFQSQEAIEIIFAS